MADTQLEMPDGTVLTFPDTMSEADMQAAAGSWWAQNQPAAPAQAPPAQAPPADPQSDFGAALSRRPGIRPGGSREVSMREGAGPIATGIVDNLIGMGEVNSPGEYLGEAMNQGGVGVQRGVLGAGDLLSYGPQVAGSYYNNEPDWPSFGMVTDAFERNVAPLALPENRRQQVAQTIGSFIPGAATAGGGLLGLMKNAVAPALGSELAGYATEGTAFEPYARFGGALLGQWGGSMIANRISPPSGPADFSRSLGGDDAEQLRQGQVLENAGVRPTVGQATGNRTLRSLEGMNSPAVEQLDDFTAAALRSSGSTYTRATPEALRDLYKTSTQTMDDVLGNIKITSNPSIGSRAAAIADDFIMDAPKNGEFGGRINDITRKLIDNANTGTTFGLDTLNKWRSALGKMTTSADPAVQNAAASLRRLIDDATDDALRAAGRAGDIEKLAASRVQFRDWLSFVDASTRAGAETGILSPQALRSAVVRQQGRRAVATGTGTTPLEDLSRAGANIFRPSPTVSAGGVRAVQGALPTGAAGIGGYAGWAMGGAPGAIAGTTLGALSPMAAQAAMRSNTMQSFLRNPSSLPKAGMRIGMGQVGVSSMQRASVAALQDAGYDTNTIGQILQAGPEAVAQALQGNP